MKLIKILMIILIAALLAGGCGRNNEDIVTTPKNGINVYYRERTEKKLGVEVMENDDSINTETFIENIKDRLFDPESDDHISLLAEGVEINDMTIQDKTLIIDFNSNYLRMSKTDEVLARAGIVRTFVQLDDIKSLMFKVDGNALLDTEGNEVGVMNASTFIDNSAQDLNSYEKDPVQLYFTNESGNALVREDRIIYHASSQSLEWAVVERVIGGPKVLGNYSTIPSNTEIIAVTVSNDICYVNLSREFLDNTTGINGKIAIYSLVNSLIESCKVSQVQLSVEGDINITYKDNISLDTPFREDLSLVKAEE